MTNRDPKLAQGIRAWQQYLWQYTVQHRRESVEVGLLVVWIFLHPGPIHTRDSVIHAKHKHTMIGKVFRGNYLRLNHGIMG